MVYKVMINYKRQCQLANVQASSEAEAVRKAMNYAQNAINAYVFSMAAVGEKPDIT
jgi:hypothetical protein